MFSETLLTWYNQAQRKLPWRSTSPTPYYVWLSEIMLQQTTVATVIPYFQSFIKKWPTLENLANASLDEILTEWQGLGYYSRARNLHKCSQLLAKDFPSTEKELLKLPGIGPYTAAAIASIAFSQKAAAVDGNVARVMSRYWALNTPTLIKDVKEKLQDFLPTERAGDFTQALMELGALVCRPTRPLCSSCPFQHDCQAYVLKKIDDFPLKPPKKKLPIRYATAFFIQKDDALLLRKRPPEGLLGGMMEIPTTAWEEKAKSKKTPDVRHTFTHFHLEIDICHLADTSKFEGTWVRLKDLKNYALPTLMKKIIKAGLKGL